MVPLSLFYREPLIFDRRQSASVSNAARGQAVSILGGYMRLD